MKRRLLVLNPPSISCVDMSKKKREIENYRLFSSMKQNKTSISNQSKIKRSMQNKTCLNLDLDTTSDLIYAFLA
jgi:hypothetical protein